MGDPFTRSMVVSIMLLLLAWGIALWWFNLPAFAAASVLAVAAVLACPPPP